MTPSRTPPPPAALQAKIAEQVARTPASRLGIRTRVLLGALVPLMVTTIWLALLMRPDIAMIPRPQLLLSLGGTVLLALLALWISATPARSGLGARVETLALVAVLAAPLYALATAVFPLHPMVPMDIPHHPGMFEGAAVCARWEIALSLISFAAMLFALRRSVPSAAVARGAALGAAAGAWGGLALHMACPLTSRAHILVGHVLPIALLALVGALTAPRLLRP